MGNAKKPGAAARRANIPTPRPPSINDQLDEHYKRAKSGNVHSGAILAQWGIKPPPESTLKPLKLDVTDKHGSRNLILHPTSVLLGLKIQYVGNTVDLIARLLRVEAMTLTRLRDGGDPVLYLEIWRTYSENVGPGAASKFGDFCDGSYGDKIENMQAERGGDPPAGLLSRLSPLNATIVRTLWNERTMNRDDFRQVVWGKRLIQPRTERVSINRLSTALLKLNCGLTCGIKNNFVSLDGTYRAPS